jgi:hypothetical protein
MQDRLTFIAAVLLIWTSSYWLASSPQTFYKLYIGLAVSVLVVCYRRRGI